MRVADSRTRPNEFARSLFDGLPARYDLLAEFLSMGQNGRWRTAMVDAVRASPASASPASSVLDVATGPAGVALQLAERTAAHVTGIDLTPAVMDALGIPGPKGTRSTKVDWEFVG